MGRWGGGEVGGWVGGWVGEWVGVLTLWTSASLARLDECLPEVGPKHEHTHTLNSKLRPLPYLSIQQLCPLKVEVRQCVDFSHS